MNPSDAPLVAGRYRVLGLLGRGGMGEVFAAEDTRDRTAVALKVLHLATRNHGTAVERLRREARAAAAIRSPFVTRILDVVEDPDRGVVLVFERLEGETLLARLKRSGPIPIAELWPMVEAIWQGLGEAHAAGIVHRDLKPANVFLARHQGEDTVKLLDFGTSKVPEALTNQTLTQLGQSLGTYAFMPPEQLNGARDVDARADIYAAATVAYLALSGKLPFQASSTVELMNVKASQPPRSLSDVMGTTVDPRLEAFLSKGLAMSREDRFPSAVAALEAWRALRPAGARSLVEATERPLQPSSPAATTPSPTHATTNDRIHLGRLVFGAVALVAIGFAMVTLVRLTLR